MREKFTHKEIQQAFKNANGNIAQAARSLGVARETFRNWVRSEKLKLTEKTVLRPLYEYSPNSTLKINPDQRRFIITSEQNNTPYHEGFMNALRICAEVRKAQIIIIPTRYKNLTAYTNKEDYKPYWTSEHEQFYLNDELHLNKNLVIMGDHKIQATAVCPLSGKGPLARTKSAIFGHAQLALEMVPTPQYELPKKLMTTGSCSMKNYSSSDIGMKASFHHSFGALMVEIEGDFFYTRQLNATDDGEFYDLDCCFKPDGTYTTGHRLEGLRCGDIHSDFIDPNVKKATFTDEDSIVKLLKPKNIYLDDVLDFYSANHHHTKSYYTRYAKHVAIVNCVHNELDRLVNLHNEIFCEEGVTYHYIASNHNDALTRWLNESNPKEDLENALLYHQFQVFMLENTKMTESGAVWPNPLEAYLYPRIKNANSTLFHSRNSKVMLFDIDMSQHGDVGSNGSKGSIQSFSQSGYKSVIAHGHSPGIKRGCMRVGTSSRLKLEYNQSGYSSWLNTHCAIYPNGKRTLIDIIGNNWRLKD